MVDEREGELERRYRELDAATREAVRGPEVLRPDLLLTFDYAYPQRRSEVRIETEEFTAVCPWTGLPDFGTLRIRYVPDRRLLELKSLKYYLLGFRSVGMVQEHAAARILDDLVSALEPRSLELELAYRVRGGLLTSVRLQHPQPDAE
jgi:7-cyano-7-deazaguanine reductase